MTPELACLAANALWGFLLVMLEIGGKTRLLGASWNAGNREQSHEFPPWIERAGRALANHKENFPLFLTAVLLVQLTNRNDAVSAWGCIAYVGIRIVYSLVYVAGIPKIRSLIWALGTASVFVVMSRAFV